VKVAKKKKKSSEKKAKCECSAKKENQNSHRILLTSSNYFWQKIHYPRFWLNVHKSGG
jgi:hypothetical protein